MNYLVRDIDDELYRQFKARAEKQDHLPMSVVLRALIAAYVAGRFDVKPVATPKAGQD